MLSTLWKTTKWLMLLLLLLIAAGGTAAVYFWNHSDELLRTALLDGIKKWAPDVTPQLGRCRVDLLGRVHLDDFSLTLSGDAAPFVALPEAVIDLDRDAFLQRQEVVIQNVELGRPQVLLSRDSDGRWNFQKLPPLPAGKKSALPEVRIDKANVRVELAQSSKTPPGILQVSSANISLNPTSKRTLDLLISADVENLGRVTLDGKLNVDAQTGSVNGTLAGLKVNRRMLEFASIFEPRAMQQIAQLETKLRAEFLKDPDPASPSPFSIQGIARKDRIQPGIRMTSNSQGEAVNSAVVPPIAVPPGAEKNRFVSANSAEAKKPISHAIAPDALGAADSILGLTAELNLGFQIERRQPESTPQVRLTCDIVSGEVTNTALAFPLADLRGQVEVTRERISIRQLGATNGPTEINVRGEVLLNEGEPTGRIGLRIDNIACDQRLRDRLSVGFGRIYDAHHPQGFIDMEAVVATTPEGKWKPESFTVSANKCSVKHDVFPYPIEDAVGTISLKGKDLVIDMRGYAGRQPITLTGHVKNPGPNAWIVFDIEVANLPIDEQFAKACPPGLQKTIAAMQLRGLVDGKWHLEKEPGEGRPFKPDLVGYLHDASMIYEPFPYRVDALSGKLTFDGKTWTFSDFKGLHGGAVLAAGGVYVKPKGEPGRLDLTVDTKDAPIDSSLFDAVPKSLKKMWQDFQPRGSIKHLVTRVEWDEGTQPIVRLPVIEISRGRSLMPRFPYELTDIEASYEYIPGHFNTQQNRRLPALLKVKSFEGRHNQTLFLVNRNAGFAEIEDNGDWHLRLENWQARKLRPDQDLQRAVTSGLRAVLATFDPEHDLDVTGLLDLRGTSDPQFPMTAAWSIKTELTGGSVAAGLNFNEVHGTLTSTGTWDGTEAKVDGTLELDSLKVFEKYELNEVKGPFKLRDGLLTFGTEKALEGVFTDDATSPKEQITAKFLQGLLTLNGQVAIDQTAGYQVRVALAQGQLETFARKYMQKGEQLRGTMQGWMDIRGEGSNARNLAGTGQLQISPAALYELPVIFHVLDVLIPTGTKAAAFSYALCSFRVSRGRFLFDAIDLVGDQVQMRGRGSASFDGDIDLLFSSMLPYSMLPKSPFPFWVPVVTEVSNLVTKATREATRGWVVVKVTGKTSDPQTEVVPAASLDEAFKGFLNTLRPLPLTPQPLRPQTANGRLDDRRALR